MVSRHVKTTSSKIVSTAFSVDLIFFTKSWENLGNTPQKGNSDAVHIFSSQFSRTERRGAKRIQTHRSVLNRLRRIRHLPSQGNFHLLQFHIPFLLHFRILCEPADCTLLQFHIRRGAGNAQEVFVRIRRVQTMEALSQFPVCISGPMCQFWHLTRSISDGTYKNFVLLHSHIPISIDMGYHLCLPADSAALIIQIGQYFFALLHFHILERKPFIRV